MPRARLAPACFVAGAVSQYGGAAIAVGLFDQVAPAGVAFLRVGWSAVVLMAWRRPLHRARRGASRAGAAPWSAARWRTVATFGVALAAMNLCFYLAIGRLPLGTAVAIEFTGPVTVAAIGARGGRGVAAMALAVAGIVLLADVRWAASAAGVGFALAAAGLWAAYIVVGSRLGQVGPGGAGLDSLAVASLLGAAAIAPVGLASLGGLTLGLALWCGLVGLLSNVVPYALDQLVFPLLRPSQFALLSTLLPATAALTGALALGQVPGRAESVGIGLVIAAVAVRPRVPRAGARA